MSPAGTTNLVKRTRATWYVHNAKNLRLDARLSMSQLAGIANVSRDTLARAEAGEAVSELVAVKIFEALKGKLTRPVTRDDHVKHSPPKR